MAKVKYKLEDLRNIGIMAHIDAVKICHCRQQ